jgi:hypothetical protein
LSLEEITLLRELEEVYKDHRFSNIEIIKILTRKIVEQIKYKTKKLKLASEGENLQAVAQETEGGCDPVNSGDARFEEPDSSGNYESIQQ